MNENEIIVKVFKTIKDKLGVCGYKTEYDDITWFLSFDMDNLIHAFDGKCFIN